jgi:hypothetical protein
MGFRPSSVSETFVSPAEWTVLSEDGRALECRVRFIYRRKTREEIDDLTKRMVAENLKDSWFLHEVTVGWKQGDVEDDEGRPEPFSSERLDWFINYGAARAMVDAFYAGSPKAKTKNS